MVTDGRVHPDQRIRGGRRSADESVPGGAADAEPAVGASGDEATRLAFWAGVGWVRTGQLQRADPVLAACEPIGVIVHDLLDRDGERGNGGT